MMNGSRDKLARLLSYATGTPDGAADNLMSRFGGVQGIACADIDELSFVDGVGDSGALLLRLVASLASRSITDSFRFGREHTDEEIVDYLKALFLPLTNETVYAMLLDDAGRVSFCEFLGEGTVNATSILPRKVLELAVRRGARSVILAHNHPAGYARPSVEDIELTELLKRMFRDSGRRLLAHYIVAGNDVTAIDIDETE